MNSVPDATTVASDASAAGQHTAMDASGPKGSPGETPDAHLRIRRYTGFSPELLALAPDFEHEAGPSIAELANIPKFRQYNLRIVVILAGDRCVALSCCRVREVMAGGVPVLREYICLGDEFYDYNTICCEPGYRTALFHAVVADARWEGADWIHLKRLLAETTPT